MRFFCRLQVKERGVWEAPSLQGDDRRRGSLSSGLWSQLTGSRTTPPPLLHIFYKNSSRCVKELNIEGKSVELLEDNKEEYLCQIKMRHSFLKQDTKKHCHSKKVYKLDFIEIKNSCQQQCEHGWP